MEKLLTPRSGRAEQQTLALLGGFCLFLSTCEYLIPKPLPFMRIGLANVPLMLAIDMVRFKSFAVLVMIKVFGQGIISGTLFSYVFLFSLAGTCSSAGAMYLLRRFLGPKRIGFIGVSVIGALCSNGSQVALAGVYIFGAAVQFLIPLFLAAGMVSGMTLGIFCEAFTARSRWYQAGCGP